MPSDKDLDEIRQYFANLNPDQFDKDFAGASPSVAPEAVDRPPVREPRAPALSLSPRSGEAIFHDLKALVAKLVDERIAERFSHSQETPDEKQNLNVGGGQNKLPGGTETINRPRVN